MRKVLLTLFLCLSLGQWLQAQSFATYTTWGKKVGATGADEALAVTQDANGNIYIAGYFNGTVDFDPGSGTANLVAAGADDGFLLKLNAQGNYVWAIRIGGTGADYARTVAVDFAGNVFVGGDFRNTVDMNPGAGTNNIVSSGLNDGFIASYTSNGTYRWAGKIGGSLTDRVHSIIMDPGGDPLVAGTFQGTVDMDPGAGTQNFTSDPATGSNDAYILKLSGTAGNYLDGVAFGGTNTGDVVWGMALNGNELLAVGEWGGTCDFDPGNGIDTLVGAGLTDGFLLRLDVFSLNYIEAYSIGGSQTDYLKGVAVDANSNVYITGSFRGTADLDPTTGINNYTSAGQTDIAVVQLKSDYSLGYIRKFGEMATDEGNSIVSLNNGNVYITGKYTNGFDWNPGAGINNGNSFGGTDVFILALDSLGNYVGHTNMGSTGNDEAKAIAKGNNNNVVLAGFFTNTMNISQFATFNLISAGLSDAFIINMEPYCQPGDMPSVAASATSICEGDSITLSISGNPSLGGGAQWNWYAGSCAGTPIGSGLQISIAPNVTNDYYASAGGGCLSQPSNCGLVSITVDAQPSIVITGDDTLCEGSQLILDASNSNAQQFLWSDGSTNTFLIDFPTSSTYYVLTASNGSCTAMDSFLVFINPVPTVNLSLNNNTLTVDQSGATYQWFNCATGQPVAGATSQSFTPPSQGSFQVLVTLGDCAQSSVCMTAGPVGIENAAIAGLELFPNPSQGLLNIRNNGQDELQSIAIYNLMGQMVFQKALQGQAAQIELQAIAPGAYFYRIYQSNSTAEGRIIFQ